MRYASGHVLDGRYRIECLLGEGGMGETYKATDLETNQVVVLKLPQIVTAGDISAFNRYRREIEIGGRLEHPGIQRLLSDDHAPYMVLEYVEGETLRSYLHTHAPLALDEALRIVRQLAETLEYVHSQGVVHRDLKPENILIDGAGCITLADFGIALRLASRRLTFSHLSNAVGTPDYMAPEQVRGERGDARTDIYALGVLLYELLTGGVPYPAEDAVTAMQRKVLTEPPLVRRKRPELPEAIDAIVYRALRRKPEERYASMTALRYDLEHLDSVVIPTYRPDVPPPKPLGDLPPWGTTARVLGAVLGAMVLLGILAEAIHRLAR